MYPNRNLSAVAQEPGIMGGQDVKNDAGIPRELSHLRGDIERLGMSVSDLRGRMDSALKPSDPPKVANGQNGPPSMSSPAAECIKDLRAMVHSIQETVSDIHHRLDV